MSDISLVAYSFQQDNTSDYCYFDVRSLMDFIIALCLLGFATLILVMILLAYKESKKYLSPGPIFKIYYILICWYVFYVAEYTYGAIGYKKLTAKGQPSSHQQIVRYSKYFQLLDYFLAFIIVGCLYFVCHLLIKKIRQKCRKNNVQFSKSQRYFQNFLNCYIYFRFLFFVPTLTLFLVQQKDIGICSIIQLAFYLLDSFLSNCVLFITLKIIRKKDIYQNEQQKTKLKRQSIILQIVGIIRLVLGSTFVLIDSSRTQDCISQKNLKRSIFYMIFGQLILHFTPVLVILSIFRMSSQQASRTLTSSDLRTRLQDQIQYTT